jgi:hypothetical protein
MKNYLIYKLFCKNKIFNKFYIGHTVDIKNRMSLHKSRLLNNNNEVYNYIRTTGGFENWDYEILTQQKLNNKSEALKLEQTYIYKYKNYLLNKNNSFNTDSEDDRYKLKKNNCYCGGIYTNNNKFNHFKTNKHINFIENNFNNLNPIIKKNSLENLENNNLENNNIFNYIKCSNLEKTRFNKKLISNINISMQTSEDNIKFQNGKPVKPVKPTKPTKPNENNENINNNIIDTYNNGTELVNKLTEEQKKILNMLMQTDREKIEKKETKLIIKLLNINK